MATAHPYQEMLDLLSEQFNRNSSGIAVIADNSSYNTYSELERNANKLREFLSQIGVARHHVVGICVEQNFDYIIAVTAVILNGSILLNIDRHKNKSILTDFISSRAPDILIIDQYFPKEIFSDGDIRFPIVFIESILCDQIQSADFVFHQSASEFDYDVMYLLNTSGSTGKSNCVMGSYTGILNRFCWQWQQFPFVPNDLICCQTSPSFTDFMWSSLGGLLVGTTTIIVPKPLFMRIPLFLDILSSHSVTHLSTIPSILRRINRAIGSTGKQLPALKFTVSSGEILYDFIAEEFLNFLPNCTLANFYGSTEIASDVTYYVVNPDCISGADEHQKVPIGRAITGVTCYVVDEKGDILKDPYVVGELIATGVCLSHGYYKNPGLTKRKFCPLFLSPNEGAIEGFKTGDLVSWLPSGELEFVGRLDDQIKISGSKCDLKEIEINLHKIAFIERAIVRVFTPSKQDTTLVAYVQLDQSCVPSVSNGPPYWKDTNRQKQIHNLLARTLPTYMAPTVYIFVKEFQHLHSGKIDTESLPDPFLLNWETDSKPSSPRVDNEIVEFVKYVFAKHLYLEASSIGLTDSFMELGGYSLLVMSLFEDIEIKFNVCMPVFEFIENSTVQNLCEFIQSNMRCEKQENTTLELALPDILPERIPFSFAQEELYYLHQSDISKYTYNEFIAVEIEGKFNVPLLQTAINDVITAHLILRTTFYLDKQEFHQTVHPNLHYKLQILQTSTDKLNQEIIDSIQQEFQLDNLPLFQVKLFILNDTERSISFSKQIDGKLVLLLVAHHILIDGLSMYKIAVELFTIYNTYLDSSAKLICTNPPQYVSFVLEERSEKYQASFKAQLEYWCTQLQVMEALHLLSDSESTADIQSADQFICEISADTKCRLLEVSLAHNTSLFTILLTTFLFLLSKYAQDQDDVTVATPVSLRPFIAQGMELIGPLINVVLIRSKFGLLKSLTQHSFSELLTKMHKTMREALANASVPLEQVVSALRIGGEVTAPFDDTLQALFVFHEHSKVLKSVEGSEYSVREYCFYPELNLQAKSSLVLSIDLLGNGGLQARLNYRTCKFSKSFMRQFGYDFIQLLQFVCARPTSLLARFSLLSKSEYKAVMSISSAPCVKPASASMAHIFHTWAVDTPNAIALEIEDRLYTYSHLYELISLIVPSLLESSQQHKCVIGICMRQSLSLITGIFAALFAGFGYVYLDPDFPAGRLQYMIQDANISAVLIDSSTELDFSSNQITALINIELILLNSNTDICMSSVQPANEIGYILYTSGSTGRPKGVIVSQANIIGRCCSTPELVGPPGARFCQVSSFSFDIYAYELYCSLLNGATLCMFERTKYLANLSLFASLLHRQYIDCMMLAPPLCDVISKCYPRVFSYLHSLMLSGDTLQPSLSNRILTQGPPRNFYNLHGITEATVVDSIYRIHELCYTDIPIGRPLTNSFIFIVDKHMNLLPKGIVGEILVGGSTVALGYLNSSEKSKEKFKTFQFSQHVTTKLFKSGDLGYLDFSGNFRFIGRSDWQIKLRGQRLELGEIERVATECAGVNEFVAVCLIEASVPVSIIGFCSTSLEEKYDSLKEELNRHFRNKLTPYMVPSQLYLLRKLPKGVTGKVDRQKLLKWIETGDISEHELMATQTMDISNNNTRVDIIARLESIYKSYFPNVDISGSSNFFNIGGDSIIALQLVSQLNASLEISVSLREFFQNSTVAKLAQFIVGKYNFKVVALDKENESKNSSLDLSKQEIFKQLIALFPNLSESNLQTELIKTEFSTHLCNTINTNFSLNLDTNDFMNILSFDQLCSLIIQQLNLQIQSEDTGTHISFPLASTQRQFALAYVLNEKESAYHIPICIYSNQLDWDIVMEFFITFIQNHTILRTVYSLSTGFSQKLIPNPKFPSTHVKITLPPGYGESPLEFPEIKNLIKSEVNSPLDLETSIPIRTTFVDIISNEITENKSLIIIIIHHIAADGWSVNLLLNEFQLFMKNYPKYILKSTNFLELTSFDDELYLKFWKDNLSKFVANELKPFMLHITEPNPLLEMPEIYKSVLEFKSTESIHRASQECGVTPFITLLSAFVYLFTFLLEPSLQPVILTPVSTRSTLISEQHFGPSVNLLPLAIDLDSEDLCSNFSFKDLTKFIQIIFHNALENSPISYEKIHPFMNKNSNGLTKLPVVFSFDSNQLQTSLDLGSKYGNAEILNAFDFLPTILHDILMEVNYTSTRIEETLTISQSRIKQEFSKNILTQYNLLLEAVCNSIDTPLSQIVALPEPHKLALTGVTCRSEFVNVVDLIYKICNENSDNIMFVFEDGSITYKQFFIECYSYARVIGDLVNESNGHPIIVVLMDLSIELIVAKIAILISNCTYLLVDPALPIKRIQNMLEATKSIAILTTKEYQRICSQVRSEFHLVSVFDRSELNCIEIPINHKFALTNPTVFVLSTSGSTGEPRFVAIPHSSLLSRIHVKSQPFYFPNGTVLICSSLSFDILTLQVYGSIFSATKGVIIHQSCLGLNLNKLCRTVIQKHITYMTLPTPVLHTVYETIPEIFEHMKFVDFGGDVAIPDIMYNILRSYPHLTLYNSYGPTEGTVLCSCAHITMEECHAPSLTIGTAVPNTNLMVVDAFLRPVPLSTPGELLISGAIMSGYLHSPKENSCKLISIQHASGDSNVYFRTGDKVRQREDGKLEFLGRNDFQVKLDGQRIELSEIENVLMKHESVQLAIVFLKTRDKSNVRILFACILCKNSVSAEQIEVHARNYLTPVMVPSKYYFYKTFPLTINGKVDRKTLFESITSDRREVKEDISLPSFVSQNLLEEVCTCWREVLGLEEVSLSQTFHSLGGTSLLLVQLHYKLQQRFNVNLSLPEILAHNTVWLQSNWIANKTGKTTETINSNPTLESPRKDMDSPNIKYPPLAVIGMSCKFPLSDSKEAFHDTLLQGKDCITEQHAEEGFIAAGGCLSEPELFDADYFNISRMDACLMDPQYRLALELSVDAIRDAALSMETETVGVFIGCASNTYLSESGVDLSTLRYDPALSFHIQRVLTEETAANSVSYHLNLTGPSLLVKNTCVSSLTALHLAARSLHSGECTAAIVGGVDVSFPQITAVREQQDMIFSPSGHCKSFDETADGLVSGCGLGLLVITTLQNAVSNGYPIYCRVIGSAINNDGSNKDTYFSPSLDRLTACITDCISLITDSKYETLVGSIEAHGAGTNIGDQIELEALHRAYSKYSNTPGSINVGSVKSNIGHLGYASGAAGLCKSVLQLERRVLYASLHFNRWNKSYIQRHSSIPFRVGCRVEPWVGSERRSAVNGMGQGGTNVHVILEEHRQTEYKPTDATRSDNGIICPISAHSEHALRSVCSELIKLIERQSEIGLDSIMASLYNTTRNLPFRKCFVSPNQFDLISQLKKWNSTELTVKHSKDVSPSNLILIFAGQGAHFTNMGLALYLDSHSFRTYFDQCVAICRSKLKFDLLDLLFTQTLSVNSTELQVYTVCLQVCLHRFLTSIGLVPSALIGHSIGEISVATCYNVFTLEDAIQLVYHRSKLMLGLKGYGMIAVKTEEITARRLATTFGLSIAAINSPIQSVLSGEECKIGELCSHLTEASVQYKLLSVPTAYHSKELDKILPEYRDLLVKYSPQFIACRYISTVTGGWVDSKTVSTVSYWEQHMVSPVLFYAALESAVEMANPVFLEIGPGNRLSSIVRINLSKYHVFPSLIAPNSNYLETFKEIWEFGINLRWSLFGFFDVSTPKLRMFPYPFQRKKFTMHDIQSVINPYGVKTPQITPQLSMPVSANPNKVPQSSFKIIDQQLSPSIMKLIKNVSTRLLEGEHHNFNISLAIGFPGGTTAFDSLTPLPISSTTIYPIGCLSSIFIYIIFNNFLATGQLTCSTRLLDMLPLEFSISGSKSDITLFQLATHTSGLPFLPSQLKWEISDLSTYSLSDLFADFVACELHTAPGEKYRYSVFGSALLTHALTAVSDKSYEDLLQTCILQPLGLTSTFITASMRTLKFKHYQGYTTEGMKVSSWKCGEAFKFSDGIHTNLHDLIRLAQFLTGHTSCEIPIDGVIDFMINSDRHSYFFLTGITNGSSIWLALDLEWKTSLILACNTSLENCKKLAKLSEFTFSTVSNLYSAFYSSNMTGGPNSIPISFGEKQITALGGGSMPAGEAPIRAINNRKQQVEPTTHFPTPELTSDDNREIRTSRDTTDIETVILESLSNLVGTDIMDRLDIFELEFSQLGLDSLLAISLAEQISSNFNRKISFNLLSEYNTISELSRYIQAEWGNFPIHVPLSSNSHTNSTNLSNGTDFFIPNTRIFQLLSNSTFPLVIEPSSEHCSDINHLKNILSKYSQTFHSLLLGSGALLFRNFKLETAEHFSDFTTELGKLFGPCLDYKDGISPRTRVLNKIYTSTEYPSKYDMSPHNEMSYSPTPPTHIVFFCLTPPKLGCGGQTPLMSSRGVLEKIPRKLLEDWNSRGLKYFWNLYSRGKGPGKSWQDTYGTEDRVCVEEYLREMGFEFEWREVRLKTSRSASVTRRHPITKAEVWFNHSLLFHPSELPDTVSSALSSFPREDYPKHCTHGDSKEISHPDIKLVKDICLSNMVMFDWEKGDVLLVDNYLVAHARKSFIGERKILVAMFRCQD